MIRRSIHPQFRSAVLADVKITTIRDRAWPVGEPIMLFCWQGLPYRSRQENFIAVEVEETSPIVIMRTNRHGSLSYMSETRLVGMPLWVCEGFDSEAAMHAWFREVVKPGETVTKHINRFHIWKGEER